MQSPDPKYINVPNICFSLSKDNDEREAEYSVQRKERGFDNSELWSLCNTIAKFTIPRLEEFIKQRDQTILDEDGFIEKCEKFLYALKLINRDDGVWIFTDKEEKDLEEGLSLFHEIFMRLWL